MYLLLSGKVEVFYETKEGQRFTVLFHQAPFLFGELEVWDKRQYIANVQALERSEVYKVSHTQFKEMIHENHQIAVIWQG